MNRTRFARLILPFVLLALAAPIAGHAGTTGFDLTLTQVESRDPVPENEIVTYTITVKNTGSNPSNPFSVHVDVTPGTVVGASGTRWICTTTATTADCTHEGAKPNGRLAADIVVSVRAPLTVDGPIFESATVFAAGEAVTNNNVVSEKTDVSGLGKYAKDIPPGGGSLTTDSGSGATATDTTYGTLVFPAGPGGVARLIEHPEQIPECSYLSCIGAALDVIEPGGYTDAAHPIVVLMVFDASIAPLANGPIGIVKTRPDEGDTSPENVPPCQVAGVAFPTPCVDSDTTTVDFDRIVKILMLSGDPWYQGITVDVPRS